MDSLETTELTFTSFADFLNHQPKEELDDKNIKIQCETFDEEEFPSFLGFDQIKVKSMEIRCNGFQAEHLKGLMLYIDDYHKPKIKIYTEDSFFPRDNSFVLIANLHKALSINLHSGDDFGKIARNREYHNYFGNQDSRQHRRDIEVLNQDVKVPFLRAQSSTILYR